jgi:hypothetical protein
MPFNFDHYRTIEHPTLNTLTACVQEGFDDFIEFPAQNHCLCFTNHREKALSQARQFKVDLIDILTRVEHGIETLDANNLPRRIYGRVLAASSPRLIVGHTDDTIAARDIINGTLDYITEQLDKNAEQCSSHRLIQRLAQLKTCSQHICKALNMDILEQRRSRTATLDYSLIATFSNSQDMSTATFIEPQAN